MCSDLDRCPVWNETWRRARKDHRCGACGEIIPTGHTYMYVSAVQDHRAWSHKSCARCWKMYEEILRYGDECLVTLDCGESWEKEMGEPPPAHVAALAFMLPGEAQTYAKRAAEKASAEIAARRSS